MNINSKISKNYNKERKQTLRTRRSLTRRQAQAAEDARKCISIILTPLLLHAALCSLVEHKSYRCLLELISYCSSGEKCDIKCYNRIA